MKEVAAMFGKKLDERFMIRRYNCRYDARFTEHGFDVYGDGIDNPYVELEPFVLFELLTGRAEIVGD
jgi:hypothetical protein